jgi:hypothetical protein
MNIVEQLKTIIGVKKGIQSHLFNLIYFGQLLDKNKSLSDYSINKNCRIYMTPIIK